MILSLKLRFNVTRAFPRPTLRELEATQAAKGVLPFPEASYLILTSVLFLAPCTNFLRHFWPPQLKALT